MNEFATLAQRLNAETARIEWPELEPHYARGATVTIAADEDLVAVAEAIVNDDQATVMTGMTRGGIARTGSDEAARWAAGGCELWAVVVPPWVLVQELATPG